MPKIDLEAIPQVNRTGYPSPYDTPVAGRWARRLAGPVGLAEMGASHVVLKPGGWSSQRHWHAEVDELLVMPSGANLRSMSGYSPWSFALSPALMQIMLQSAALRFCR